MFKKRLKCCLHYPQCNWATSLEAVNEITFSFLWSQTELHPYVKPHQYQARKSSNWGLRVALCEWDQRGYLDVQWRKVPAWCFQFTLKTTHGDRMRLLVLWRGWRILGLWRSSYWLFEWLLSQALNANKNLKKNECEIMFILYRKSWFIYYALCMNSWINHSRKQYQPLSKV